ncbi:beta-propeller uncharacterized protein DUF5122 [Tahibacter aquaticus]|uniref:Beta-propeller uncharacterized protein DUF5122 n=1 Tax=Tahibacter aquaticus TaxID=520092 RepID=A0A4R6YUD2_9GAMM|nr:hypothetical protein [Tahibacter aquaticus]TDR42068.1 beta-propeller uncharacterized protein DUF5122 [Tahibacter aquaticus]
MRHFCVRSFLAARRDGHCLAVRPRPCLAAYALAAHLLTVATAATSAAPDNGDFDRSYAGRGWNTIFVDPPGRSRYDSARMLVVQYDGSIVVAGLAGRDPQYNGNGLLAAARLNPDGSRHVQWASAEDTFGGVYPGLIVWPYEFDFVAWAAAGNNPSGNQGIGFAGSGRVVTGTSVNYAKLFAVSPAGTTLNGGLGKCEVIAGGALRDFYALGAGSYSADQAHITGYVRRYSDQAYVAATCAIQRNEQKTVTVSDSLPADPPGVIGTVGIAPHFFRDGSTNYNLSQRVYRNFNSAADNDVKLCDPGRDFRTNPPGVYTNCKVFEPNLGGHLDDQLWSILPNYYSIRTTGFSMSQVQNAAGGGDDRRVLTASRPYFYQVNDSGQSYSDPEVSRSYVLGDATSPSTALSFHFPQGVYDPRGAGRIWVVMALRNYPGPDEYREIAVVRLKFSDLSLDTTFGNGTGWRRYSLDGAEVRPHAIAIDQQGRVLVAGERRYNPDSDDWDFFVMRLNDDVLFRDDFGQDTP